MPTRLKPRMMATFRAEKCCRSPKYAAMMTPMNSSRISRNLPCCSEVGLAGLVDQLRDLPHRLVHHHVLELRVDHEAEGEPERADHQAGEQQRVTVGAEEAHGAQVGQHQVRFAAGVVSGRIGLRCGQWRHGERHCAEHERGEHPSGHSHSHGSSSSAELKFGPTYVRKVRPCVRPGFPFGGSGDQPQTVDYSRALGGQTLSRRAMLVNSV